MKETKFKQTEVGMIPSDWDVAVLGKITTHVDYRGKTPAKKPLGIQLITAKNIRMGYIDYKTNQEFVSEDDYSEVMKRGLPQKGDVLITTEAPCGYVAQIEYEKVALAQRVIKYRGNECLSNDYLSRYFQSELFQNILASLNTGGTVQGIKGSVLHTLPVIFPPTIEEQQRIANALSDIDSLIANLEKLIAKKKNIKQGAMQQLLTGRKRLPAFAPAKPTYKQTELGTIPEDWEVKSFSDVFEILPNNTLARADLNENKGSFRDVHYGDVLVQFGEWIDCEKVSLPFINCNVRFNKTTLKNGDVVIADTAEDETVGKATEIFNVDNQSVVSGLHTIPVRPKFSFAAKWLGYYMNSSCWHDQILPFITGTKVSAISKAAVAQTKLFYPQKKEEQTAIANILSDMDSEIQTLETKLAKYRKLKTGMMQQLLTGKIRLVD